MKIMVGTELAWDRPGALLINNIDQYFSSILHKCEPLSLLWDTGDASHHGSLGPGGLQAFPHSGFQKDGAQLLLIPSLEVALLPCLVRHSQQCATRYSWRMVWGLTKEKVHTPFPQSFFLNLLHSYLHMLRHFLNVIVLNGLKLTKIGYNNFGTLRLFLLLL